MNYSNTSNPVSPSDVTLREFTMSADVTLVWSYAGLDSPNVCARTMIVTASAPNLSLTLPPADQSSIGYATLISNIGSNTFTVKDNSGGVITTITTSQSKLISLRTQTNAAGTWLPTMLGATTSAADASLLAGYGLNVIAAALNSNVVATTFATTQTFNVNNRASLAIWTGGTGVANLDLAATLTNGWWMQFYNAGTGNIIITPGGGNLINGLSSLTLLPTDSCQVYCTGTGFYSVGLGRAVTTSDSRLSKNVAGGVDVTLTTAEVVNNVISFTGALTANINVIFPVNVKNYYVSNNTTGAFTLTCKTAAGAGVVVGQTNSSIITVDGTNVIFANNTNSGTVTSITAGTGLTGGVITNSGTISLANTAVSAGTYGGVSNPFVTLTVDGQGRVTSASNTPIINDGSLRVANTTDTTKQVAFDLSALTTGTVRTVAIPDANLTVVGTATTQTITNKTLTNCTANTQTLGDNSTKLATTAYVDASGSKTNLLINPDGRIYQRTVSATADDVYFADRWYMLTQTGAVTPSQLTAPEDGFPYGIRVTQSQVAAQRFGFAQIIEGANCKQLRGQNAAMQPRIRISNSQAVRYAILGWTGTEDTVTSDVVNDWTSATYTAGNFFLAANVTVIAIGTQTPSANTWTSLASITGACGSSFNNIIVFVWTEATAAQNVTLDFDYIKINSGSSVTSFDTVFTVTQDNLCKRYYEKLGMIFYSGVAGVPLFWQTTKRITPGSITSVPSTGSGAVFTAIDTASAYQSSLNSTFVTGYVTTDVEL